MEQVELALIGWFKPSLNWSEVKRSSVSVSCDWVHGEKKLGKQFMLTETASNAIDALAKELGISRSEVVERAARCGGMEAAKKFDPKPLKVAS